MAPIAHAVTVSLEDLKNGTVALEKLQEAFGTDSLGILVVKDVPSVFVELRQRLLSYSSYLGNLPATELTKLENEKAKYVTGWSCGKETLKNGQVDTLKGSYYANCAFYVDASRDCATATSEFSPEDFPEFLSHNIWPDTDELPGFRETLEQLCRLIIDAAVLVARACDRFAVQAIPDYPEGYLETVVSTSTTTKARLLHYFPEEPKHRPETSNGAEEETKEDDDDWCATHLDTGCLTGLTSAMFVDESVSVPNIPPGHTGLLPPLAELDASPDPAAGLYIISRTGETVQVKIPRDCIAFQTGEALERITAGQFKAVPHFVRGARPDNFDQTTNSDGRPRRIARNTLAVFTQPNLGDEVDRELHINFGQFARSIFSKNTVG